MRHELKLRIVSVKQVRNISPHFVRITFEGDTLSDFTSASFDDHVKLMMPIDTGKPIVLPSPPTREALAAIPVVRRDYTPRAFDGRTLDLEMALHGEGPAASWASRAKAGDLAAIGGPKGSMVVPLEFSYHLLAGDETALPAIARRLEELPSGVRADVVVQIDDIADRRELESRATTNVQWVVRASNAPNVFLNAVASLRAETDDGFAWAAGEAAAMSAVRRCFVEHHRFDRERVRVAAYWKRGVESHHERIED